MLRDRVPENSQHQRGGGQAQLVEGDRELLPGGRSLADVQGEHLVGYGMKTIRLKRARFTTMTPWSIARTRREMV